ncbi:MAG: malto-oligosyltrehalose trehalohydrolase, partial [Actinomycetota bacterium]
WAPLAKKVCLQAETSTGTRLYPLSRDICGYWQGKVKAGPGTRYFYLLDGKLKTADPASFRQPEGVFGPSETISLQDFAWGDSSWKVPPLKEFVIYELHAGTFGSGRGFSSVTEKLKYLKELGINAVQLMPVSQFSGDRNWGYDGVFPFAVQDTYGGPRQLQRLVNAAHSRGLAVILDVVYNHLGPEGSHFPQFGPYFTSAYQTPWGKALNFDGPWSREVRNYFIQNALFWFRYYHIDALRLDAVHGIFDFSAKHFLAELSEAVKKYCLINRRTHYLIAESDRNDSALIRENDEGGYGIHAQWNDDFHHSLHACLTGEREGYYADFGELSHIKKAMEEGYCYDGCYSRYRKRNHGNSSRGLGGHKFIVFAQNHDQVGNRMLGERLINLVCFEAAKLAAAMVILSPFIPLIFMGEEYGEQNPFLYFTSHRDPELARAAAQGREEEFSAFRWKGAPPHPQDTATFNRSRVRGCQPENERHQVMLGYYQALIALRKQNPALRNPDLKSCRVAVDEKTGVLVARRRKGSQVMAAVASFNKEETAAGLKLGTGAFEKVFCSADKKWMGPGGLLPSLIQSGNYRLAGYSFTLYQGNH